MAYNYLRYAIVCPYIQLFNHKIKGTLSFKQQRWCLCKWHVMPERPSPTYNNDIRRRLNMYQFCILYFIIITLIKIIIIAMFTICIIFLYVYICNIVINRNINILILSYLWLFI